MDDATQLRDGRPTDLLRAGDPAAFEQWVRRHAGPMLALARRILRHEEDAREAVQDGFLSAFRALDRFDGRSAPATWLHRIVLNAALMKLRTRRRKPEQSIEPLLPHFGDDEHMDPPPGRWAAADRMARDELRALVRDKINRLPEPYRLVVMLRDMDGLDTAETAKILGTTAQVVKTRLHRARQALRQLLDPHMRGTESCS